MPIYLHGLSLKNYRGIGSKTQVIAPLKSCNFFIGTNNSGKSCVLNFISAHLAKIIPNNRSASLTFSSLEIHLGSTSSQVEVGYALPSAEVLKRVKIITNEHVSGPLGTSTETLEKLLEKLSDNGLIFIGATATTLQQQRFLKYEDDQLRRLLTSTEWQTLWRAITGHNSGNLDSHWFPQSILRILQVLQPDFPATKIIPAKRQIGAKGASFDDFSGAGLIDKLAALQNPGPTERGLRKTFEKINAFLQDVTGDATSLIEIPHDREEILVHKESRVLPLSSLGTGIHEVVMIAAFCTLTEKSIVCIEEPEIHLHPLLQKKLIRYITKNTSNQYFIATHSASVIDYADATVFHVTHTDYSTKIELAAAPAQRFRVCQDLGYRASDLLQTNAIIWVEGPSDRIYLKHWIAALNPDLQEGIHYSIMFYRGRLLSHLSATDDEVTEFISLKKLNRNTAIIIDSDKKIAQSKINDTKKRVIAEFESSSDIAWLTAGREIENYIKPEILTGALKNIYFDFHSIESTERYSHRLHFYEAGKTLKIRTDIDKVKIARLVCESPADFEPFDLKSQMQRIVAMINAANT